MRNGENSVMYILFSLLLILFSTQSLAVEGYSVGATGPAYAQRTGAIGMIDIRDYGVDCTYTVASSTSSTAVTNALAATGEGKTLFVPSGCMPALASSTTGLTVPVGSSIFCEDSTAGFQVALKRCEGVSAGWMDGAHCSVDADCIDKNGSQSGTCVGSQFAPTPATDYIMLKEGSASALYPINQDTTITITNCTFLAGQWDQFPQCTCSGIGCDDPTGTDNVRESQACRQVCAGGSVAGKGCDVDADCTGGGTCEGRATCSNATNGSANDCFYEAGSAAGGGNITALNFPNTRTILKNVTFKNFRYSSDIVELGDFSEMQQCTQVNTTTTVPYGNVTFGTAGVAALTYENPWAVKVAKLGSSSVVNGGRWFARDGFEPRSGKTNLRISDVRINGRGAGSLVTLPNDSWLSDSYLSTYETGSIGVNTTGNHTTGARIDSSYISAETGIKIDDYGKVSGSLVSVSAEGIVGQVRGEFPSQLRVSDTTVTGFSGVGVRLGAYSQLTGSLIAGSTTTPYRTYSLDGVTILDGSIGAELSSLQQAITGNIFSGSFTAAKRGIWGHFNVNWTGNRVINTNGPGVMPDSAGWHIDGSYFNQGANGYCSDKTATNFMKACTCKTQQCSTGTTPGKNCDDDSVNEDAQCSGSGVCTTLAATDNPYGKYGGTTTQTCYATGEETNGSSNICDSTYSKAECTVSANIQVNGYTASGATMPDDAILAIDRGTAGTGAVAHLIVSDAILAHGGSGAANIQFNDSKRCYHSNVTTATQCKGSGGNTGSTCTGDYDADGTPQCTSTGCLWGDGYCCARFGKLCTSDSDCSTGYTCNQVNTGYGVVTQLSNNYHFSDFQGVDFNLSSGGGIFKNLNINDNTFESSNGIKFPSTASRITTALVNGNNFSTSTDDELQNWANSMGITSNNLGIAPATDQPVGITLWNGPGVGSIGAFEAVEIYGTGTTNMVKQAASSSQVVIGVAIADCATNSTDCKIAGPGSLTTCKTTGTIVAGDPLTMSSTTGTFKKATTGEPIIARATAADSSGYTRCLFVGAPVHGDGVYTGKRLVPILGGTWCDGTSTTPCLDSKNTFPADNTTRYFRAIGTSTAANTEAEFEAILGLPVNLHSASCFLSSGTGASKTRTFTLMKNGSAETGCQITITGDTNGTDTDCTGVSLGSTDTLTWRSEASSSPAATKVQCVIWAAL